MSEKLREPKGFFQEVVRRLAEAAMDVTHHDIDSQETEAVHEIQAMERRFTSILRGKLSERITRAPQPLSPTLKAPDRDGGGE